MLPEPKLLNTLLRLFAAVGDASVPADSLPTFSLTLMTGLVVATPGMPRIIRTFGFPIQVTDAAGRPVFTAAKKLMSSKDEISVNTSGGTFKVISQENRITDIPSNWDIITPDGQTIGVIDDDFVTALDGVKFADNPALSDFLAGSVHRRLGMRAAPMYWIKDPSGIQLGFIAPDQKSLAIEQIPLYQFTRQLPFASRLITPFYVVQLGGKLVMKLKKEHTFLVDTYTLQAVEPFTDADEKLLLPSVALTIVYERQRLKDMYE